MVLRNQHDAEALRWPQRSRLGPLGKAFGVGKVQLRYLWPVALSEQVLCMYGQELFLKKTLLDSIVNCRVASRGTYVLYLSSWVMEPMLDSSRVAMMGALARAVGD